MERAQSFSGGQRPGSSAGAGAPFAYQQRLLERTSSTRSGTLSRSGSQSSNNILLSNPTGTPNRRWTPGHRTGTSLDVMRSKWEERTRAESSGEEGSPVHEGRLATAKFESAELPSTPSSSRTMGIASRLPYTAETATFGTLKRSSYQEEHRTPTALKRHTLPAPIIASPLSPNSTGLTVESPDNDNDASLLSSPTPARIHLPSIPGFSSSRPSVSQRINEYAFGREEKQPNPSPPVRPHRAHTIDSSLNSNSTGSSTASDATTSSSSIASTSSRTFHSDSSPSHGLPRRPTSLYGDPFTASSTSTSPSSDKYSYTIRPRASSTVSRASSTSVSPQKLTEFSKPAPTPESPSSVMNPQPYRSSYMNRKANRYGSQLTAGRTLGRHLPRIASGDAPEDWVADEKPETKAEEPAPTPPPDDWRARRAAREKREKEARREIRESRAPFLERSNTDFTGVADADDVAGIPGRLRLSKDKMPSAPTSPLPSQRLTRGLWADVQRNLLQAYEYLCHVGEAQQWIEGCLGEELGFGVVEMEDEMRNGVVLAKLVRVFQGEQAVRRIYEVLFLFSLLLVSAQCRHCDRPQSSIFDIRIISTYLSISCDM